MTSKDVALYYYGIYVEEAPPKYVMFQESLQKYESVYCFFNIGYNVQ